MQLQAAIKKANLNNLSEFKQLIQFSMMLFEMFPEKIAQNICLKKYLQNRVYASQYTQIAKQLYPALRVSGLRNATL